jgi:predicted enzyme related to lactoylglutathione lyase
VTGAAVPPQLNVVTLGARDFGTLREFYIGLGWSLAVDLEDFAAFETRGAVLTLFPLESLAADGHVSAAPRTPGAMRGFSLAINVEQRSQVDETIEAVREAGGRVTKEPEDATEFEGRSAYFADPEDNFWEVVHLSPDSRVAAAVRRATGQPSAGSGSSNS